MAHTTENTTGFKAYTATAVAIGLGVRVKLDSSGTISAAGVTDEWIGTAAEAIAASGTGNVRLRNSPGTHMMVAAGAITKGAKLYPAANGKVDDTSGTGVFIGFQAGETVGADGDIFEAVPSDHIDFTAAAAQAAITDSTGAGANDDTISDGVTVTALTDNSGGAAADGTIGAVTAPTALTHAVGTADNTVDDVGGAFNQTTLNNNFKELTTAQEADRVAIVALTDAVKELSTKINTIVTDLTTQNQNDSDIAAKFNAIRTALINAGIIKGSA